MRTCVGCRATEPAQVLTRVALQTVEGSTPAAVFDEQRTLGGRGAWIHPGKDCLDKALKKGAFNRVFRTRVTTDQLVIKT